VNDQTRRCIKKNRNVMKVGASNISDSIDFRKFDLVQNEVGISLWWIWVIKQTAKYGSA